MDNADTNFAINAMPRWEVNNNSANESAYTAHKQPDKRYSIPLVGGKFIEKVYVTAEQDFTVQVVLYFQDFRRFHQSRQSGWLLEVFVPLQQ